MALLDFVKTKQYKNFMSKLYGWGAAVVIIGALFKINHYTGADIMLIIGLGTESMIFFFSAFEPPHVDPDWSLVYPELAGIYNEDELEANKANSKNKNSSTQELDLMLEKAKIGPELITSLGNGLTKLADTTSKLSNVADASLANDHYVTTMKRATEGADILNDSYRKTASTLEQSAVASQEQLTHIKATSKNAASLSSMFAEVGESLKEDVQANKVFSASLTNATASANKFIEKYSESAELLTATLHHNGHNRPAGALLAHCQGMLRMGFQARVIDPFNGRMRLKPAGQFQRPCALRLHAYVKSLHALEQYPRVEG